MRGMCPAVPIIGDRERKLKKGDLVFVDIGYGWNGYHTDCSRAYAFGAEPPEDAVSCHRECVRIQEEAAKRLKPGAIPSEIYASLTDSLSADFLAGFMGAGEDKAKFLGHGIGLQIDEYPVLVKGFDEPLEENMVIAVEPKYGMKRLGTVGVEDTYIVTKEGGRCLTDGSRDIIVVK
jgi:Xaa-Pro aminopeptidase